MCHWFQKNLQQRMPDLKIAKIIRSTLQVKNDGVGPQNFLGLSGVPKGKYSCKALIFYFGLLLRALDQIALKRFQDAQKAHMCPESSVH